MPPPVDAPSIVGPSSAGVAKVSARGKVTVPKQSIDCTGAGPDCSVKASAKARTRKLGGSAFKVKAGKKGKVTVKLTRKALRVLKRLGKMKARITITVTRGSERAKKTVNVTLKAPRRK